MTKNSWNPGTTPVLIFNPSQAIDASWHVDGYELVLGVETIGSVSLFKAASDRLLNYEYYPNSVMATTSNFVLAGRQLRPGDLIVQRIRLIPKILDVITMNRVQYMIFERRRKGFTVYTTENHLEMGEWTVAVSLKENGQVLLTSHSIVKPGPKMPIWANPFARIYQLRAHRLGLEHFKNLLIDL